MIIKILRVFLIVLVIFLAVTGIAASIFHFLREYYNPGFLEFPTVVSIHVIFGAIYLAISPFQFIEKLRSKQLSYHRWAGRLLVTIGLAIGASATFIAIVIPFSGIWESVINGFFGIFFLFAIVKGFLHIRSHEIEQHREWMLRAFSLGLSIATMRLIFIPMLMLMGIKNQQEIAKFSIISFAIAFVIHWLFAELWIVKTRKNQLT